MNAPSLPTLAEYRQRPGQEAAARDLTTNACHRIAQAMRIANLRMVQAFGCTNHGEIWNQNTQQLYVHTLDIAQLFTI